jgi:hypothetical protein
MKFTIKGNLTGYLCEDCNEPIGNVEVLLYQPWQKENVLEKAIASEKETFRLVNQEEANARKSLLIASTKTDEIGNFEFTIDEKFGGTAFDIDFVCGTVPRIPPKAPHRAPVQLHITTFYPKWKIDERQENYAFQWKFPIPSKWWCQIRGLFFDAWVICGYLRSCDTGNPIPGALVTAWDADFLHDDNLGSTTTDASGFFRIDYTSIQFKQTFLSPWINLETDPGLPLTFNSGPDVYFKATVAGVKVIDETKVDRRDNVGYCLCVNLCSKINIGDPGDNFPSVWTGIGTDFNISTIAPKGFDAAGYAGSGKYALTGVIDLTGQAALKTASGNEIDYRFLVSDLTTLNGGPAPADVNFSKIVGLTPSLFASSVVAKLVDKSDFTKIYDVSSDLSDFDAEGWFSVNKAIDRTLTALLLGPASNFLVMDVDTLLSLNTRALTKALDVADGAVKVGDAVPTALKIPIEKVAIRFEIREVINRAAKVFNPLPGNKTTLNSAIINNNAVFIKLAITELEGALCTPIGGNVHAKYTVYHPHLGAAMMHLNNNSITVNRDVTDGFLTLSGNLSPAVDGNANINMPINNPPNDMTKCTYSLKFWALARLHDGRNGVGYTGPLEQLFFYNG